MNEKIEKFKDIVIENFSRKDFEWHEWMVDYHLEIVACIAMELCDAYPKADRDVVKVLAWFHDFGKPIDEKRESEMTLVEGKKALLECGFTADFINKVVENWQLMEKKNEIDLRTAPIEAQIVSSADGASHFVGIFYATYFGDGDDFETTKAELKKKIEKDWTRKIVLPEAREAFQKRYEMARELFGDFPDKFLRKQV